VIDLKKDEPVVDPITKSFVKLICRRASIQTNCTIVICYLIIKIHSSNYIYMMMITNNQLYAIYTQIVTRNLSAKNIWISDIYSRSNTISWKEVEKHIRKWKYVKLYLLLVSQHDEDKWDLPNELHKGSQLLYQKWWDCKQLIMCKLLDSIL
jgi:hypothetical protein